MSRHSTERSSLVDVIESPRSFRIVEFGELFSSDVSGPADSEPLVIFGSVVGRDARLHAGVVFNRAVFGDTDDLELTKTHQPHLNRILQEIAKLRQSTEEDFGAFREDAVGRCVRLGYEVLSGVKIGRTKAGKEIAEYFYAQPLEETVADLISREFVPGLEESGPDDGAPALEIDLSLADPSPRTLRIIGAIMGSQLLPACISGPVPFQR